MARKTELTKFELQVLSATNIRKACALFDSNDPWLLGSNRKSKERHCIRETLVAIQLGFTHP